MNSLKVIFGNIFVLAGLLGLINYGGAAIWHLEDFVSKTRGFQDKRSSYPNYIDKDWAIIHFDEFARLESRYEDFSVWRREKYSGQTINIDENGLRSTDKVSIDKPKAVVWLFGGSTMWGTGVGDSDTIPSILARQFGYEASNYGESGYTNRQSLNTLMDEISKKPAPDFVVFYDGVNDVYHRCRSRTDGMGSSREEQIRWRMKLNPKSLRWQFETPRNMFFKKLKLRTKSQPNNHCIHDTAKSRLVANSTVDNWIYAKVISERFGADFIAILQPVVYFSKTKLNHFTPNVGTKKQFEIVYPRIRDYAAKHGLKLSDYTEKLDIDEYVYIDFAHLSANGNQVIASHIAAELDRVMANP